MSHCVALMPACPELDFVVIIFILFLGFLFTSGSCYCTSIINSHQVFFQNARRGRKGCSPVGAALFSGIPGGPLSCGCRTPTQTSEPEGELDSLKIIAWSESLSTPGRAPFQASLAGRGCFCTAETHSPLETLHPKEG